MEDVLDFMESIGLETKPNTPEEAMMQHLTEGNCGKIHSIRYWLRHEMARFYYMKKDNIQITRSIIENGQLVNKPLSNIEYAKIAITYHLRGNYGSWFMEGVTNRPKCDIVKVVQDIVEHPSIVDVIEKTY